MKKSVPKKRKSKGKRHHVHAESLENIAEECGKYGTQIMAGVTLAQIFRDEATRLRSILR